MYKYLVIFVIIIALIFGVYYYREQSKHYCEMYNNAQANNEYLIKKRREDNEKTLEISRRNRELEEAAKQDDFNWLADISNTSVIKRLQAN